MMRNKILNIVVEAVNSMNELLEDKVSIEKGNDCELYGGSGVLDSISLVSLIVAIEEGVENEFNLSIILADEKAMSQKRSPFATINTLVAYTETLVNMEISNG